MKKKLRTSKRNLSNFCDVAKAIQRGMIIAVNAYINNLTSNSRIQEKRNKSSPKLAQGKKEEILEK
jgi:hypothetical protein